MSPAQGDRGHHWLQTLARLLKPIIKVMSHTYVRALRSAKPCLGRTFLTLCASSHHAPTRGCSCGLISCPATGSLDWCVFFTSGLLVWFRWSAPWSRSSQVPTSWSGLRAAARLSAAICSLSGGRSTRRSTSRHGLLWPMGAASVCLLHVPLVSSPAAAARAHAERCRPYPRGTPHMEALCNGRNEFFRPPQIFGEV